MSLPSPTGAGLDCLNDMTTLESSDSSESPEDKNEECENFLFVKKRIKANVYMTMNANPVADPGFPRGGGANSPGGAPTYEIAKFSEKLHEIERIWTPPGGGRVPRAPLRSANAILPEEFLVMLGAVEVSSSIFATMCDTLPFRRAIFTPGIMPSTEN